MNKTKVIVTLDHKEKHYLVGQTGYVDGYLSRGQNEYPYAIVVINNKFVMIPLGALETI